MFCFERHFEIRHIPAMFKSIPITDIIITTIPPIQYTTFPAITYSFPFQLEHSRVESFILLKIINSALKIFYNYLILMITKVYVDFFTTFDILVNHFISDVIKSIPFSITVIICKKHIFN